ncbi:hypothetical protein [Modestobacter sp. VKM Ac-2985]|uniref:hypothetical protein n=1 Tax=Modestobacter sp. VKM Ac-2985 TaxID=3004139 RepID=UPI0022AB7F82|nr:hypothetical protein [Modestobacter sp. VKM Ac-2985]MCZ2837727.1 hypothetical protein [Modestobacter sp. VKM Ac-2985]
MAARKKSSAGPAPRLGHGEFVAYPGGPTAIYDLLERLSAAAGDSPDFGTPGISLDRKRLTVRWHGELPGPVRAVLADPGVEVTVQQTPCRPGDLRAEAERLLREHPDVLAAATARPEGDGIEVLVPPAVADPAGGPDQAVAGLSDVPLFAEVGEAPPA